LESGLLTTEFLTGRIYYLKTGRVSWVLLNIEVGYLPGTHVHDRSRDYLRSVVSEASDGITSVKTEQNGLNMFRKRHVEKTSTGRRRLSLVGTEWFVLISI